MGRRATVGVNESLKEGWRLIEALVERQYDLASTRQLAEAADVNYAQARRLMMTWEELGLVEKKSDLWRLTQKLQSDIPGRLRAILRAKFDELDRVPNAEFGMRKAE